MRVGVVPDEERLAVLLGLVHEALAVLDQHLVEGLHVVLGLAAFLPILPPGHVRERGERPLVLDPLLADLAPARHLGGVVLVGGPGMDEVARAVLVPLVLGEAVPVRVRHRVQVIEVAEKLVEPVHRRQELVQVAQMVLAELAGLVALRLEHGRERHRLGRQADVRARLAHRREPGADRQLAGDEVRPPGGAARLGVVVREPHALGGELVEVRRLAGHDALMVGADVEPADVVAHDDEDVRLLLLRRGGRPARHCRRRARSVSRPPADVLRAFIDGLPLSLDPLGLGTQQRSALSPPAGALTAACRDQGHKSSHQELAAEKPSMAMHGASPFSWGWTGAPLPERPPGDLAPVCCS